MNRSLFLQIAILLTLAPAAVSGQSKPPGIKLPPKPVEDKPRVYKLSVDPAAEPSPPLKYQLLPPFEQQKPGNAVPYYYRALQSLRLSYPKFTQRFYVTFNKSNDTPLNQLPKQDIRDILNSSSIAQSQLKVEKAAFRERCDWDLRLRDLGGSDFITFELEEFQKMRELARLLMMKARLEVAEHRYDDAIRTLQIGYRMAIDTAKPKILVNDLIGVAIAAILNRPALDLIESPDSPNMYWALTSLPRPLIDVRPAIEVQARLPLKMFPYLKDAETAGRSVEEWRKLLTASVHVVETDNFPNDLSEVRPSWKSRLLAATRIMKGYPAAKRELPGYGYSAEQIEAMPVGQVIAIHEAHNYRHVSDQMLKWMHLPYWQAREGFKRSMLQLKRDGSFDPPGTGRTIIGIAWSTMPAFEQAMFAAARADRRIAALRTIEAIRMYAAVNNGQLPNTLDEIDVVPVPQDPMTGKNFPYRLEDDRAILDAPALPGQLKRHFAWRYEISLADRTNKIIPP